VWGVSAADHGQWRWTATLLEPALVLAAVLLAVPATAQPSNGRVEIGGGVRWVGGIPFDRVSATETSPGGGRLTLFNSDTELEAMPGVEARASVRITSILAAEAAFSYGSTNLDTRISSDFEGAPDVTVRAAIRQYTIEGGITAQLARWRAGRFAPFASAGAAYLRQLYDGRTIIENGRSYYAGGGVRYSLTSGGGRVKGSGIRADVRATFPSGGVALDEDMHMAPSLSASVFVRF
jgi:outer membrane protein with beta-barrel domain